MIRHLFRHRLIGAVTPIDPYLTRLNQSLRAAGFPVAIELTRSGRALRLRATMPDAMGTWRQQRISTRFLWPDGVDGAKAMAEALGKDLRLARMGESFPHERWLVADRPLADGEAISGVEALRLTEQLWQKRARNPGNAETWITSYRRPLAPLLPVEAITPQHLRALVMSTKPNTRTRHRTGAAAALAATALGLGADLRVELQELGRGYNLKQTAKRELPSDEQITEVIDGLPVGWQWIAGICATYGSRPHEAILYATVQPSGLLAIRDGKTGARQSLPLPRAWIDRWDLGRQRLPKIRMDRSNKESGRLLSYTMRRLGAPFTAYDLRHAWAVRAILEPKISPSLAAKSMGHSMTMHSQTYQRWFDQQSLLGVLETL